ncbi:hypothetical protein V8G54_009231 [Vigna mungo]|uniref:Uncharacterized protein n=1 Tax=Vigna mungo TaxID=3915 RepID=A0AAQ3S599_VIGMU
MLLPLYFPSVSTKFTTSNRLNSVCDVPAYNPSILPTTLVFGSDPTVSALSVIPTRPKEVALYLGIGGTMGTEVALLPVNLSWKKNLKWLNLRVLCKPNSLGFTVPTKPVSSAKVEVRT